MSDDESDSGRPSEYWRFSLVGRGFVCCILRQERQKQEEGE